MNKDSPYKEFYNPEEDDKMKFSTKFGILISLIAIVITFFTC